MAAKFLELIFLKSLLLLACSAEAVASPAALPVVPNGSPGAFQHGTYPSKGDRTHAGVDIVAPCGSPIYPLADGRVVDAIRSPSDPDFKSLGYMAIIEHLPSIAGKVFYSMYLHLQEPPLAGDEHWITRKMVLGKVGRTGAADVCHLHFEVRYFKPRFSPVWKNIYGPGDQRSSEHFKSQWEEPLAFTKKLVAASEVAASESMPSAPLPEFSFRMRDGSTLTGQLKDDWIKLRTGSGDVSVLPKDVLSYAQGELRLKNGEVHTGEIFNHPGLSVLTKKKKLSLAPKNIVWFGIGTPPEKLEPTPSHRSAEVAELQKQKLKREKEDEARRARDRQLTASVYSSFEFFARELVGLYRRGGLRLRPIGMRDVSNYGVLQQITPDIRTGFGWAVTVKNSYDSDTLVILGIGFLGELERALLILPEGASSFVDIKLSFSTPLPGMSSTCSAFIEIGSLTRARRTFRHEFPCDENILVTKQSEIRGAFDSAVRAVLGP